MPSYHPKFPNCVDANSYRRPRKTPAFETVSLEMDRIYSAVNLSHVERAHLLELHLHLSQAESNHRNEIPNAPLTLSVVLAEFANFQRRNGLALAEGADDDI